MFIVRKDFAADNPQRRRGVGSKAEVVLSNGSEGLHVPRLMTFKETRLGFRTVWTARTKAKSWAPFVELTGWMTSRFRLLSDVGAKIERIIR